MRYALNCMALCDSAQNKLAKVKCLNMLGLVYYEMQYPDNAVEIFNSALDLEMSIKDSSMLSRILGNLGDLYFNDGDTLLT